MEKNVSLVEMIEEKLNKDKISLPIHPDIMGSLSTLLSNENIDADKISALVEKDPSLTAKILNLSNSPVYAGLVNIKNIEQAIVRLGVKTVKNFLMTITVKDVFKGKEGFLQDRFSMNWKHSLACAICARKIAENCNLSFISEEAYVLGLLHDIGTIPILSSIVDIQKKKSQIEMSNELIDEVIRTFHPWAAKKILEDFNFNEKLIKITETHHEPDSYEDQDDPLFCILQVADQILKKSGIALDPDPNISIVSLIYTSKLGLDPMFISLTEVDIEDNFINTDKLL